MKACRYPLKDLYNAIGTRILPAAGDVTEENFGISEELREIMQEEVSTVIHAAAQVSLQGGFTKKTVQKARAFRHGMDGAI